MPKPPQPSRRLISKRPTERGTGSSSSADLRGHNSSSNRRQSPARMRRSERVVFSSAEKRTEDGGAMPAASSASYCAKRQVKSSRSSNSISLIAGVQHTLKFLDRPGPKFAASGITATDVRGDLVEGQLIAV